MAGYSGTPLARKLGIKEGSRFVVRGGPPDLGAALEPIPDGARQLRRVSPPLDVVVAFFTARREVVARWPRLTAAVAPHGTVWIGWPKRASGVPTDITEDTLRADLLPTGWVDNKVCAIDDTWSGLRFALRRELR